MPNVTLAIKKELLEKGRAYARQQNLSLNALIRKLLEEKVGGHQQQSIDAILALSEDIQVSSEGKAWSREDLYE